MQPILTGLRIIEASAFIAAPMCGMTLAQLGADVIRFDPIAGGIDYRRWPVTAANHSIYWADLNKGKRSFAVDLKHPEGRELITRLITAPGRDAGIFSTNLPASGWLAYDTLKARRADVIQLAIVGDRHGSTALDYTVNAQVGYPLLTGPADDARPVNHVLPAWDITAAMLAATSLLAALRFRDRTGGHEPASDTGKGSIAWRFQHLTCCFWVTFPMPWPLKRRSASSIGEWRSVRRLASSFGSILLPKPPPLFQKP